MVERLTPLLELNLGGIAVRLPPGTLGTAMKLAIRSTMELDSKR